MAQIDLSKVGVDISQARGPASVIPQGNELIANAVSSLGDRVINVFGEMAIKARENDIKQSAWDAQTKYTKQMQQDILENASKMDGNGNIISKINQDGTVEYEQDDKGNPISYSDKIATRVKENSSKFLEGFNGDKDKENYFRGLSQDYNKETLVKSVIAQNTIIEKKTFEKSGQDFDTITADLTKYDQPDFLRIADQLTNQATKKTRDTAGSVNYLESEKLIDEKTHKIAKLMADKSLMHAETDISSDKMLSEFGGAQVLFDPKARKYLYTFLRDKYDDKEVMGYMKNMLTSQRDAVSRYRKTLEVKLAGNQVILKKLERSGSLDFSNPEKLQMDDIDIEAELPPKESAVFKEAQASAQDESKKTNPFYEKLTPQEQQDWIEKVISIKFKQDDTHNKDLDHKWKNLVGYQGTNDGRNDQITVNQKARELYNLNVMSDNADWKSPIQRTDKLAELAEAQIKSMMAGSVFNMNPQQVSRLVSTIKPRMNQFILETSKLPNGEYDPEMVKVLQDKTIGMARIGGATEQAAQKDAQRLISEYSKDPDGYRLKYGLQSGYTNLAMKAANGDSNAMRRLSIMKDLHERSMNIPVTEQKYSIDSNVVDQVGNNMNKPLMSGDYLGAANYMNNLFSNSPSGLTSKILKDLERNGKASKEVIGSYLFNSLGGSVDNKSLAESLSRVSPDKVKQVNQVLENIWGADSFKDKNASLTSSIFDKIGSKYPTLSKIGNENGSFTKQSLTNYIAHDIKTRIAANPDIDTDAEIESAISKLGSRVTDVQTSGMFSSNKVRGIFKKGSVDKVDTDALDQSLEDGIKHGRVIIDTAKLPPVMNEFLKKAGKDKASDSEKSQEVLKRFKTSYVSKSLTGSSNDAEVNLTDGDFMTPLYIKKKDSKGRWMQSEVHTIIGFSK